MRVGEMGERVVRGRRGERRRGDEVRAGEMGERAVKKEGEEEMR